MINKQFDLHKFKAQSAKMSDFLKGKGHDISRITLLNGLSVMMGEKNWNTLKPKLDLPPEQKNLKEQLLSVSNTPDNGNWDKDDIIIFNEIFNKNNLIQCVESLFKYPESYPRYNIDEIYEYKLFDLYRIYENLSIEDALLKLDDPSFLIKYLKLTDDYNDISKVHGDSLFNFNAFINGEIERRNLIDAAIAKIDTARSGLGATQNRFESTINNLNNTVTNLSAAQSRIQDADYATEVANMSRAQILQQAGTSVLAQANQSTQSVLSLLR